MLSLNQINKRLPPLLLVIDQNLHIIEMNSAASDFFKCDLGETVQLVELIPQLADIAEHPREKIKMNFNSALYNFNIFYEALGENTRIILQDISQEEALSAENKLFLEIINQLDEGVQISDAEDRMLYCNAASERMEGLKAEQYRGKKNVEVYKCHNTGLIGRVRTSGAAIKNIYHQYETYNGKKVQDVICSTYPHFADQEVSAVYSILHDVTTLNRYIEENIQIKKAVPPTIKNGTHYYFADLIGNDPLFVHAKEIAHRVALRDSNILLVGETGTGKELFAQSIHNASLVSKHPFVALNCAAIPDGLLERLLFGCTRGAYTGAIEAAGLFEIAGHGTVYLDEINSMELSAQAKLLRVIQERCVRRIGASQEREIHCRIISSINIDAHAAVTGNHIRQDLYYRISTTVINIPSLRERKKDIPVLAQSFLKKLSEKFHLNTSEIDSEALSLLTSYDWPGNVRELEHVLESTISILDPQVSTLRTEHLDTSFLKLVQAVTNSFGGYITNNLEQQEKTAILTALNKFRGNISQAARELGLLRQTLQYKIKKYKITFDKIEESDTNPVADFPQHEYLQI